MRLLPLGDRALVVEVDDLDAVHRLARSAASTDLEGVVDLVPGARTVTVHVARPDHLESVRRALLSLELVGETAPQGPSIVIEVDYDGPDLDAAADAMDISVTDLVQRHTDESWRVAFGGFAPGFAYLAPTRYEWSVPRLDAPRPSVAAGSVALADTWSGIYPRSSPGGWLLIGRTDTLLFDVDRDPPALLHPGVNVEFRARRCRSTTTERSQ